MTEISFEVVTLEQLVRKTPVVLIVKPRTPAYSGEAVPIHFDFGKYPPFVQVVFHYTVVDLLRGSMTFDRSIDVVDDHKLELHKGYYLKGRHKSPIYPRYTPRALQAADELQIIFIRKYDDGRYRFVVVDAIEGIALRDDIIKVLRESQNM